MKIKTKILKNMITKAIKGSSNNKMIPITSLIGIEVKNDILTLITTDGSNQLKVKQKIELNQEIIVSDEFYTIVNAETFAKLVAKTTKEFIELNNNENYLEVKGNGTYKLEISINEDGQIRRFEKEEVKEKVTEISIEKLKNGLLATKVSIAKTLEIPFITGYYLGENIYTTDRQLLTKVEDKLVENPILISSEMAKLLQLLEGKNVTLYQKENKLLFETDNIEIYGYELEDKEKYPIQDLEKCINLPFENLIKVNKNELLAILDRMSLFVDKEKEKNGIYLKFKKDYLEIQSQKSSANEIINYENNVNIENEFEYLIDIDMLKLEIKTLSNNIVEIFYGQDNLIKIVENNIIIIIALLDKEN